MKRLVVVLSLVLASHAADIKDLVEANRKFTGTLYSVSIFSYLFFIQII